MKQFKIRFLGFIEHLNSKKIFVICVVFICLRLGFLVLFNGNFNSVEDFRIATNIVSGQGYSLNPELGSTAIKVPVYPLFLSLFIKLFGAYAKFWIVFVQQIIIGLIPLLFFFLSNRTNIKNQIRFAGLLFLFHPSYFYYPMVIEVTNIFIPLTIIWLIFYMDLKLAINKDILNYNIILKNGIMSSIIILTQPIVVPVIVIFYLYLLIKNYKKYFSKILIIGIICSIGISPWIIRNYVTFDKFIPAKSPFWMNFYEGFMFEHHLKTQFDIIDTNSKLLINSMKKTQNDVKMEKYYKPIVEKTISDNPMIYIEKTIYQAFIYWWIPPRYFSDSSLQFLIIRKLPVILLNITFVFGIILMFKKNKYEAIAILSVLFYFTLVYSLTLVANIRFKLDIEWIELITVSQIIIYLISSTKTKLK